MNTAKIGKMQSSMSNQKTTATLPEVDNKLISVAVERIIRTLNLCLALCKRRSSYAQFKGQDFNAEFHLDLKRFILPTNGLTVNGKIFDLLFLQE
jgi:hypothetical protein